MAETHHHFLADEHLAYFVNGGLGRIEPVDEFHGCLVRAAVQRPPKRADRAGDARVQVGQRRRAYPGGEGRGVEFVLRIENQRNVHNPSKQRARALPREGRQKVAGDAVLVGVDVDTDAVVAVAVPVVDDRRHRTEQPVGHFPLAVEVALGLQIAEHGTPGSHHIHGVGVGGNPLQYLAERFGQSPQPFQLVAVRLELPGVGKHAVEDQVGHFLERRPGGEIGDVVAAIGEPRSRTPHRAQGCLAGALAAQTRPAQSLVSHRLPPAFR